MKINWKFWSRKDKYDQPFRRIYKGDVPFLKDADNIGRGGSTRSRKQSTSIRRSRQTTENGDDEETRPRPVRRQSVSRGSFKKSGKQKECFPEKFPTNMIITSRYTLWDFIPRNLFEQFQRVVNFYFLIVAVVQLNIDSPVHPITAVAPIAFVIAVSAVKQGYEDWLRHKNDNQVNNRHVKAVRNGELVEVKAKDILVGDIVKLESEEQVPTDILLLGSSDEFLRCQINTANLDGETNLKLRYCPSGLPHFKAPEDFNHLHVIVECEHPCEDLYEFSGSLLLPTDKLSEMHWLPSAESTDTLDESSKGSQDEHIESLKSSGIIRQAMTDFISIPLSMENLVLRGTRLKNTEFIYGIVVYTGRDTRLARNSEKTQFKFSTVESAVNLYLIFFIILLILMVIFCTIMYFFLDWYPGVDDDPWFLSGLQDVRSTGGEIFQTVAAFIILYNYIIPISLYVTIELQKFLGSKFFVWDKEMIDEEGKVPLCNTSDLNEELGQIEYLFSDKTGTLTQNVMQFRHCSIQGARYEYKSDEKLYPMKPPEVRDDADTRFVDVLNNNTAFHFFQTLALCHSVQVVPKRRPSFDAGLKPAISVIDFKFGKKEGKKSGFKNGRRLSVNTPEPHKRDVTILDWDASGGTEYQASSPDEKALLESCEKLGIVYVGEKEDMMTLNISGNTEKFKRLMHLEFDADRKCMSVIVENSNGEIWLLTKGAESSIIPKCDDGPCEETLKHVMDYALMGLRTLAVSQRKLTREEFDQFNAELRAARRLIKNRQEKVREVYSSIEQHMTLIGATGVEDQLQENVPETLQSFAAAGIRVWMLTGDKLETGVNVAVSCGLITASTKQFILSRTSDPNEIRAKLEEFKKDIDPSDNTCFVIDGESLAVSFKECSDLLRDVSMAALRVVCCRMAPLQKAQVVQMVKNSPSRPTCCAVGDGANDCAMILAAHIGIGILGKEGRQAARCADFALSKFGYLKKAILVHGHWYYVRLANLANYFFYKNIVFVFPQFFYSFYSNFSYLAMFNGLFLMNFNIFFASCPIFFYGLFEQPYSAEMLMTSPHLYRKNRKNSLMTVKKFVPWLVSGFWHAVVCYFLAHFSWTHIYDLDDFSTFGTVVITGVIVAANIKMAIETKYITWLYILSQLISYGTFFILCAIVSEANLEPVGFSPGEFRHVYFKILSSVNFWLLMLLVTVASALPDLVYAVVRHSWKHIARHFRTFGKDRKLLKLRRKSMPFPALLFSKQRSGSVVVSSAL